MGALDLSSNKCYPLDMPNVESTDSRLKLDSRVGASIDISNSRVFVFGGCTLDIDVPTDFTTNSLQKLFEQRLTCDGVDINSGNVDFNDYLSSECFRLSLINRKWTHYRQNKTNDEKLSKPRPRMFHGMVIYDNYVYVGCGLAFDENNKLKVLNDVWKFDIIERKWTCLYPEGNEKIIRRFDQVVSILPNLEMFDKNLIHPGMIIIGGLDENNDYVQSVESMSAVNNEKGVMISTDFIEYRDFSLIFEDDENERETHTENNNNQKSSQTPKLPKRHPLKIRKSLNDVYSTTCSSSNQTKIVLFERSPDVNKYEPLIIFNESSNGIRLPHHCDYDITNLSTMEYPTLGTFGDNIIVTGFLGTEKKISSFIFNIKTNAWTKLQISCMHKIYSHRLSKGFVWESHHKIAFLGSMDMNKSSGSVNFFDNLVILSLPFTNFFSKSPGVNANPNKARLISPGTSSIHSSQRMNDISSTHSNETRKRSDSITSATSNSIFNKNFMTSSINNTNINDQMGGFAAYSHRVAQQMQINSIRSVLPSYAIAIGKNAFERNTSFSDFDIVCSDGTIISVPLTLCRRRWGVGFDELFADAYAKSYIECRSFDLSSRGSTYGSNESNDEYSSYNSRQNMIHKSGIPTIFHSQSFKKTASSTDEIIRNSRNTNNSNNNLTSNNNSTPSFRSPFKERYRDDLSPDRISRSNSTVNSRNSSRNNSISGNTLFPNATLNRVSISLSKTRNNSYSLNHNTNSRHNSISYFPISRRNSNVSPSRRGSTGMPMTNSLPARRGSTLSRTSYTSSSTNSYNSISSNLSKMINNEYQMSKERTSGDYSTLFSTSNVSGKNEVNKNGEGVVSDEINLPEALLKCLNSNEIPDQLPMPKVLPNGEEMKEEEMSNNDNSNNNEQKRGKSIDELLNEDVIDMLKRRYANGERGDEYDYIYDNEGGNDSNEGMKNINNNNNSNKFNSLRLPRVLYLPYSKTTVRAIVEYMYSGQIGANWKLFPTGVGTLICSKQLSIPLLYDMILELMFVVLGIIESKLKSYLVLKLENNSEEGINDAIYNILDTTGSDDVALDWKLLVEAANNSRRDSGSTIGSDIIIEENNEIKLNEKLTNIESNHHNSNNNNTTTTNNNINNDNNTSNITYNNNNINTIDIGQLDGMLLNTTSTINDAPDVVISNMKEEYIDKLEKLEEVTINNHSAIIHRHFAEKKQYAAEVFDNLIGLLNCK